ncbi:Uncharacterised protein [uncultured archaeon]|nr:Uncharacterised protein [uncultured archaeon]
MRSAAEKELGTSRLEDLADGIFGFAMTLLVLGIDVPQNIPKNQADQALLQHLIGLVPQFLIYALAFFTLGSLWYSHQLHFRHIKKVDARLIWSNILGFMFIALLPFTTNLAGDFGDHQMGILPFEVNLLLLGLVFYSEWSYISSHPHLLHEELDPLTLARGKEKNAITVVLALACIALSFFIPSWSAIPLAASPFIKMRGRYRFK